MWRLTVYCLDCFVTVCAITDHFDRNITRQQFANAPPRQRLIVNYQSSNFCRGHGLIIAALPLRSLRLCGAIKCNNPKNRRDAENAELTQSYPHYGDPFRLNGISTVTFNPPSGISCSSNCCLTSYSRSRRSFVKLNPRPRFPELP